MKAQFTDAVLHMHSGNRAEVAAGDTPAAARTRAGGRRHKAAAAPGAHNHTALDDECRR